jgi:hypothetical protein
LTPFLGCIKKRQHISVSGAAREPFLKRLSELPSTDEENSQVYIKNIMIMLHMGPIKKTPMFIFIFRILLKQAWMLLLLPLKERK